MTLPSDGKASSHCDPPGLKTAYVIVPDTGFPLEMGLGGAQEISIPPDGNIESNIIAIYLSIICKDTRS